MKFCKIKLEFYSRFFISVVMRCVIFSRFQSKTFFVNIYTLLRSDAEGLRSELFFPKDQDVPLLGPACVVAGLNS